MILISSGICDDQLLECLATSESVASNFFHIIDSPLFHDICVRVKWIPWDRIIGDRIRRSSTQGNKPRQSIDQLL